MVFVKSPHSMFPLLIQMQDDWTGLNFKMEKGEPTGHLFAWFVRRIQGGAQFIFISISTSFVEKERDEKKCKIIKINKVIHL